MNKPLVFGAICAMGAIITDRNAYKKAKQADPTATFDWILFGARIAKASLLGAAVGGGIDVSAALSLVLGN